MNLIKTLIFHLLLTFRGLILGISKLFSLLFLMSFCLIMFITEFRSVTPLAGKIMVLTVGIFSTLINWFYDYLVLYFSPDNIEVRLYR